MRVRDFTGMAVQVKPSPPPSNVDVTPSRPPPPQPGIASNCGKYEGSAHFSRRLVNSSRLHGTTKLLLNLAPRARPKFAAERLARFGDGAARFRLAGVVGLAAQTARP